MGLSDEAQVAETKEAIAGEWQYKALGQLFRS